MNKTSFLAILGAVGMAALTGQALASTVTYTGYTVLNDQNVTLVDPSLSINESGGSGQITLTGTNTPGGTLNVWCVDIEQYLNGSGSFAGGSSQLTAAVTNDVNALIYNGSPLLGSSFDVSAAIQVAIWTMEYGPGLTVSGSSSMLALASSYVTDVTNGTWLPNPNGQMTYLDGQGTNQSQMMGYYPVPEPASLLALGSGLFGLGLFGRRKNRAAK